MKKIVAHNKLFLILLSVFLGLSGIVLILLHKSTIHLFINQYHSDFFDFLFKYITHLGDGLAPTILAVFLLVFYSIRKGFIIGGGAVIAGLLAQFFKRVVFSDMLRPKAYFSDIVDLYLVPGVETHSFNSFPSGHATTAFCLFFIISWMSNQGVYNIVWFMVALIVAFSRVYLSQHFLVDIYFGSALGVLSAMVSILIFSNWQKKWLDKSMIKVLLR